MRLADMTAARSIPGSTQKVPWQPFYDAHLDEPAQVCSLLLTGNTSRVCSCYAFCRLSGMSRLWRVPWAGGAIPDYDLPNL